MKYKTRIYFVIIFLILVLNLVPLYYRQTEKESTRFNSDEEFNNLITSDDSVAFDPEWMRFRTSGEGCFGIALDSSENVYLAGEAEYYDGFLMKYDKYGNFLWEQAYDSRFRCITLDSTGNIYIAGYNWDTVGYNINIELLKYNSAGDLQWVRSFDKRVHDEAYDIALDSSRNIYVVGYTYDELSSKDAILIKFNMYGNYVWDRVLDIYEEDEGYGVALDSLNNVYITGTSDGSINEIFLAKYTSGGTLQWSRTWGGSGAKDIAIDNSNNIYITGYRYNDLLVVKFNDAGTEIWNRVWGPNNDDEGYGIDVDNLGNVYVTGISSRSSRDVVFINYDAEGNYLFHTYYMGPNNDFGNSIAVAPSKNVYVGGGLGNPGYYYGLVVKYNPCPKIIINSPQPYELFVHDAPNYDVDISDNDLINTYYKINNGPSHPIIEATGTIDKVEWDACENGTVTLRFYARDNSITLYEEVIVRKDILGPEFEIISPTPQWLFEDQAPHYELTQSHLEYEAIWYTVNDSQPYITNSLTGTLDQVLWDNLDSGAVEIKFFMNDSLGNINSQSVLVYKNYDSPILQIISPSDSQLYGTYSPNYEILIYSAFNISRMWYSLNNGLNFTFSSLSGKIDQSLWDSCENGTVMMTFYVNNSLGKMDSAEVSVRKNIYYPFIDIVKPIMDHEYGIKSPRYEVYISGISTNQTWYTINDGVKNFFSESHGSINQSYWNLFGTEGIKITFYANSSFGDFNSEEVHVFKNQSTPNITIITPTYNEIFGIETINYELQIDDPNLISIWYSLNDGLNMTLPSISGIIDETYWKSCGNGTIEICFYANNTYGNIGKSDVIIQRDIYFPFLAIISPIQNQLFGLAPPSFNISVSSLAIDSMWYSLNGLSNITFFTTSGLIDSSAWEVCGNGTISLKFYVNNTYGQINTKEMLITKNVRTPEITINFPQSLSLFGLETISYNINVDDPELETTWYDLNGIYSEIITQNQGFINSTLWEACGNGTVTISFYANNSLGNVGSAQVMVYRDVYFPFIDVLSPTANQLCGILPPTYNLSISTSALDSMWYTLNDGHITIITSPEGLIDQEIWDDYGEELISIKFFANNTYGIINFKEVIISKLTHLVSRNAYALIVGVSNYPGTSYDLSYCDDDADSVYNMLINDYNFLPENIILIKNTEATKSSIDNAFTTISSLIGPDDIFYFYYSGHGGSEISTSSFTVSINSPHPYPNYYDHTWYVSSPDAAYFRVHFTNFDLESGYDYLYLGDAMISQGYYYDSYTGHRTNFWSDWIPVLNDNRIYLRMISDFSYNYWGFRIDQIEVMQYSNPHYLCPYDSIPSSPNNYYLDAYLDSKLDSLNCDNIFTIMDSCNSGGMIPESQGSNRFIMSACRDGQVSYEDPTLDHGIFSYFLIHSLDNANDQNLDGVISMEEIFSYVSSRTQSYSSSYGPGYCSHPQISDGIPGQAVLYPSVGSVNINPVDNKLYYSFYLYGHGNLKTLNLSVCSIAPTVTFKTEEIKYQIVSPTGFGYYNGVIEMEAGYTIGGIELLAEVEGYRLITIKLQFGDTDNDGLTDFFEIFEGNGLDPTNNDTDNDGVLDGEELNIYGTDPLESDSDSDGLLDGQEINDFGTDPLSPDSDDDEINDYDEINLYGTNPLSIDTDSDTISDYSEIFIFFTDPLDSDTDSDAISDGDEINIHFTDPINNDTDSDGLLDGEEFYTYYTDPLKEDTDEDGINDFDEIIVYNTDPLNIDSDSDTMPDGWEIINYLNPLMNDSLLDLDNDSLSNILEYQYNTLPFDNDTDSDLLVDGDEVFLYNTNPILYDTDGDGLSDYEEVMGYLTNPIQEDSDSDGISDYDEIFTYLTDPLDNDTDSDMIPDGWEVDNLLDPLTNDTALDPDNDLLTNLDEFLHNTSAQNNDTDTDGLLDGEEVFTYYTNPTKEDSDNDGLLDGEEVTNYGTDPLDNDTDSDGLLDGVEVSIYGTNPLSGDTDLDEMPDKWEVDYLLDPLVNDTMLDPDIDMLTNLEEYQYGTNPQDSDTDDDGWDDGTEIDHGTDPLDPNSHPNSPSPSPTIPGYGLSLTIVLIAIITLIFIKKNRL